VEDVGTYIIGPFGLFYGYLVYLRLFGKVYGYLVYLPVLVYCTKKKNLATLDDVERCCSFPNRGEQKNGKI
jgi:hypothetical protein